MNVVVAYDVSTVSKAGRRRLRHVAKLCQRYGQRVQYSVFECTVDEERLAQLLHELERVVDPASDSLRIYRLHGARDETVLVLGRDRYVSFDSPLIY